MAHRALVAYERPDGRYNMHYSHEGAYELRLATDITAETPFGGTVLIPTSETDWNSCWRSNQAAPASP